MSGLKSAWELSLEKSDKMDPGIKKRKKLTQKQKEQIGEIRKDYHAKIADKDITLQYKLQNLADRTPPEQMEQVAEQLKEEFAGEKEALEKEMEGKIESFHQ